MPDSISIPLNHDLAALIDATDADRVLARDWYAVWQHNRWYVHSWGNDARRPILLHRFVIDAPDGVLVDHRNGDGLDCRRANLRQCDHFGNMQNARLSRANTTGFKGVTFHAKSQRWRAQIVEHRRYHFLGSFASAEGAALAYDAAARLYFGEFARLNFPRDGERGVD